MNSADKKKLTKQSTFDGSVTRSKQNSFANKSETSFTLPIRQIITGVSTSSNVEVEYGIGGICSSKPTIHESLLSTTVVLVWFKLISRCLYYQFSIDHVEDSRPALKEVVINEAAVVLMMLIVILMNKVKAHLIYVRNQK